MDQGIIKENLRKALRKSVQCQKNGYPELSKQYSLMAKYYQKCIRKEDEREQLH